MQRHLYAIAIILLFLVAAMPLSGCVPDENQARATQLPTASPAEETATSIVTSTPGITTTPLATPTFSPTLPSPALTILPASGPPGTEIMVAGEGLPPNTSVQLGVGQEGSKPDTPFEAQTTASGSMTRTLLIPNQAEPGQRWVVVAHKETPTLDVTSNVFEVTEQEHYGIVEISPLSGPPGTLVRVMAQDFPPNAEVKIGVGRVNSEYDAIARAQTNDEGRVDTQIKMPPFVEPEDDWVVVVEAEHRPAKAISGVFNVTRPEATSSPPTSTAHANIYLIALDDNGQSGKRIGCNDSVVAVKVEINSTADPLTATMRKLLSLQDRTHEPSGLYNALYQSDLSLEEVRMTNGEATIRFSGTLRVGGVCDEPRIKAQLRQTALQYTSVKKVSIIVNGTLLEDEL